MKKKIWYIIPFKWSAKGRKRARNLIFQHLNSHQSTTVDGVKCNALNRFYWVGQVKPPKNIRGGLNRRLHRSEVIEQDAERERERERAITNCKIYSMTVPATFVMWKERKKERETICAGSLTQLRLTSTQNYYLKPLTDDVARHKRWFYSLKISSLSPKFTLHVSRWRSKRKREREREKKRKTWFCPRKKSQVKCLLHLAEFISCQVNLIVESFWVERAICPRNKRRRKKDAKEENVPNCRCCFWCLELHPGEHKPLQSLNATLFFWFCLTFSLKKKETTGSPTRNKAVFDTWSFQCQIKANTVTPVSDNLKVARLTDFLSLDIFSPVAKLRKSPGSTDGSLWPLEIV